jgi:glycosyltransferase involved in cell wall biosynthesis
MKLALLTNFIPPYRVPLFMELRKHVDALRIFVSTRMESDRAWQPDWADLDVAVQRTVTFTRTWKTDRFRVPYEVHVPYDTLPQLRRFAPDVILTAQMGARSLQAVIYGKATRTPVVIWATLADHLEDSLGRTRAVFRRALFRHVANVVANGRSGAAYLQRMGVQPGRITIIPQTTSLAEFLSIPLERHADDRRTLLVVGALNERKGTDLLLRGLAMLQQPARLVVVGDGPLRSRLQQVPLPAHVQVEWIGHVPYERLSDFHARGGIMVFPTLGDEWGLVVNEALAAGMPVLGSDYSQAVQDLVQDGKNGWVFRPDSEHEMAAALQRALNTSDDELLRMRSVARTSVAGLQPEMIASRFAAVLRNVQQTR